jgi:hypothetical protein
MKFIELVKATAPIRQSRNAEELTATMEAIPRSKVQRQVAAKLSKVGTEGSAAP